MMDKDEKTEVGPQRGDAPLFADALIVAEDGAPPQFQLDPYAQYASVDTSDTAGAAHNAIDAVSPVFAVARQRAALNAGRALDPNDPGVERRSVIMPEGERAYAEAEERIMANATFAAANPVEVGALNVFEQAAAEQTEDADVKEERKMERKTLPTSSRTATPSVEESSPEPERDVRTSAVETNRGYDTTTSSVTSAPGFGSTLTSAPSGTPSGSGYTPGSTPSSPV